MARQNPGQCASLRIDTVISRPSLVRYPGNCRLGLTAGSGGVEAMVVERMSLGKVHTALARSDTSTTAAMAVRARLNRAGARPVGRFMADCVWPDAIRVA